MNLNNQTFNFGSASAFMLGRNITGISGFSYKVEQETQMNFGAGNQAVSIGRGRKTVEGSLTLYGYEIFALQKALGPGKDLPDLPAFDITFTYGDDPTQMVSITIKSVAISGYEWANDNATTEDTAEVTFVAAALVTL